VATVCDRFRSARTTVAARSPTAESAAKIIVTARWPVVAA
jgi:hypothetical protein